MNEKVIAAMRAWSQAKCNCPGRYPHVRVVPKQTLDPLFGGMITRYETVPKKDNEVCERERLWRAYVQIRDEAHAVAG